METLRSICEEGNHFFQFLCRYHFTSEDTDNSSNVLQTAIQSEAQKRIHQLTMLKVPVSSHLQSELFEMEAVEAWALLQDDFERSIERFVDGFIETLKELEEHQIVGTIDWPIETGCRFRFFETRLSAGKESTSNRIYMHKVWMKETKRTAEVRSSLHGQQQHLAFAKRHPLPKFPRPIPSRVQSLLQAIPTWLWEETEVVEGDLFRTDKGERFLKSEPYSVTEVGYHHDPAVTLGPFVLAAWVCEELDAEVHSAKSRKKQNREAFGRQSQAIRFASYKPFAVAASLQIIAAFLHLAAAANWPNLHLFAFLSGLVMLLPFVPAVGQLALSHGVKADATFFVLGGATAVFGTLALQSVALAVIYLTFPLVLGSGLLLATFGYLARELTVTLKIFH